MPSRVQRLIASARKRAIQSDPDSAVIVELANEVIRLRNEMPCKECGGTKRVSTGEVYMGGPETFDTCDACKKHPGLEYKPMKEIR